MAGEASEILGPDKLENVVLVDNDISSANTQISTFPDR